MSFSMRPPVAGKGKKKSLSAASFTSGTKQYGLVIPKKDSRKKELPTGFNVFAAAAEKRGKEKDKPDKDKDVRRRVATEAARSLQQSQVEKQRAEALAQDASVFDYDAVYDDMKSSRESEAAKRAAKREVDKKQPKYIGTLLQQAKIREVENERIRERRLLHERKADDALYGDKEKLISASYKRKLQEMQRWDAEDARLAALEDHEDVTKQGEHAMAGFYANLNKNIAMGGSTTHARSAYTAKNGEEPAGSEREHLPEREEAQDEPAARSGAPPAEDRSSPARDASPERREVSVEADASEKLEELKPSKEAAIAAARARFLARKAQRKTPAS